MRFSLQNNHSFFVFLTSVVMCLALACSQVEAASSKYAAIVVDARTGKVLHSENADSRRFPASLTKMMTLYLTFEALERGKIKKQTRVPFSAQAASQPPTKIGVKAGGSLSVEQAVMSLITRSANDASMALAELLGGSEQRFALMMTQKARSLGMRGTVFRNPHGLPNESQFTTARDMATLGIALREHFPQYYGYFSVKSFKYGRQRIANHNKLLGKIRGVDGIKTGYTRASGFNLVSSVTDGNRRIVAVVLGGASGRARDARMAQLINANMGKARSGNGALIARGGESESAFKRFTAAILPKNDAPTPDWRPDQDVEVASAEEGEAWQPEGEVAEGGEGEADELPSVPARKQGRIKGKLTPPAEVAFAPVDTPRRPNADVDQTHTASTAASGEWVIQVASSPSQSEAKAALSRTRGMLADAAGYTVTFEKGGTTYHRARFSGFESKTAANQACKTLKRQKVACYATQQE